MPLSQLNIQLGAINRKPAPLPMFPAPEPLNLEGSPGKMALGRLVHQNHCHGCAEPRCTAGLTRACASASNCEKVQKRKPHYLSRGFFLLEVTTDKAYHWPFTWADSFSLSEPWQLRSGHFRQKFEEKKKSGVTGTGLCSLAKPMCCVTRK